MPRRRLRAVEAELAAFPWAKGMDQAKLDGEKKALEERTKAIAAFREQPRGVVGPTADDRRGRRRADTVITSLSGDAEVETGAGKATRPRPRSNW